MFLSGFLLFLVEPMVAKMVLPILGGVPMVWNGCVVFFQIVMLGGLRLCVRRVAAGSGSASHVVASRRRAGRARRSCCRS